MSDRKRILYLDTLRLIAAAMVVMIHVGGMFTMNSSSHLPWIEVLKGLSACAVPVFFMISGALMLNPGYEISARKIIIRILKVVAIVFIWNIIAAITIQGRTAVMDILKVMVKGHFHMWFFDYYIGAILLLPVMKGFVEYKDGRFIPFYLIACFLLASAFFTISRLPWHQEEIQIIANKLHIEMADFCGYMILGYWLSTSSRKFSPVLLTMGVFAMGLSIAVISMRSDIVYSTTSFTVFVIAESVFVFLLVKQLLEGKTISSSAAGYISMGVFLIHPMIFENLPEQWWSNPNLVIPIYMLVLVGSGAIAYLITKIPFVGKHLLSV